MEKHRIETLYTESEIAERVDTLAKEISENLPKDLIVIPLLKGSYVFTADLMRAMHQYEMTPQLDFLTLSSYQDRTTPAKKVTINRDITEEVAGRQVLIVDDILESGKTLSYAHNLISARGAKNIKIAVLLEKPGKRKAPIEADFVGYTVPDKFVVGYGLDYANYYRELPFIGAIEVN